MRPYYTGVYENGGGIKNGCLREKVVTVDLRGLRDLGGLALDQADFLSTFARSHRMVHWEMP